ncbi:hypothetical protein [Catellatospora sichuanensis]|uniref:hypothetical protein n=1 Tax=Catellatospora sichuanensis TaxID=1969805 RepID=UPI001183D7EC|nr:hypothetical protein [Catellatospora sichuanensis]
MLALGKLVIPAGVGLLVAFATGASGLESSPTYLLVTTILLAVGLYGSTFGIDLPHARRDWRTIVAAVTIGVFAKAAIIGVSLALAFQNPLYLVLGVAVAQIDPLAAAAIIGNPRMSPRAKSILAAWSSFDDPITVLLSVYAAAIVATAQGVPQLQTGAGGSYLNNLAANVVFIAVAFLGWYWLRCFPKAMAVFALALIALAVWQFTMIGLAVAGLFIRPNISRQLSWAVQAALIGAAFMLGLLLTEGVNIGAGLALGAAAFAAQVIVGYALTRKLPAGDRAHLALAQQNGITAIILSLLLQAQFDGVIAVVAPAILVVNVIHLVANTLLDRRATPAPEAVVPLPYQAGPSADLGHETQPR